MLEGAKRIGNNCRALINRGIQNLQVEVGLAMIKGGKVAEFYVVNPGIAAASAFMSIGSGMIAVAGICNLQKIVYERLGTVISGLKGENEQVMNKFQKEIDGIKGSINTFIGNLIDKLKKEMGPNAIDYDLDDHDISHAFEEWISTSDITKLSSPQSRQRLKELIMEHIQMDEKDQGYAKMIDDALQSDDFMGNLAGKMKSLREKVENELHNQPHNPAQNQTDDDEFVPPRGRGGQNGKTA